MIAWKVSYLRHHENEYYFHAATGSGTFGVGPSLAAENTPGFHAYRDRGLIWERWQHKLLRETGVELEVEVDQTIAGPVAEEVLARSQAVKAVYVPLSCGVAGCGNVSGDSTLLLTVEGRMVNRRCAEHGGDVPLEHVSDALGIPVRGILIPRELRPPIRFVD
jgi:hypothetical protein